MLRRSNLESALPCGDKVSLIRDEFGVSSLTVEYMMIFLVLSHEAINKILRIGAIQEHTHTPSFGMYKLLSN